MCWKTRVSPGTRPRIQGSDNPWGADNQQERLESCIRESSETIRQTPEKSGDDMVRSAWRHAERSRNDCAPALQRAGVTTMNGPKVSAFVALVKFGYMLENPSI